MAKLSAGLLLYRYVDDELQVLLVHLGGPYWRGKSEGVWSIPKGEFAEGEDPFAAARREFEEETGSAAPADLDAYIPLTTVKQPSGKLVSAWAVHGDFDPSTLRSNTFTIEWPPHSGRQQEFPEVDRAEWFRTADAELCIQNAQRPLLHELELLLRDAS